MSTARERVARDLRRPPDLQGGPDLRRLADPLRPEPSSVPSENGLAFARAHARLTEAIAHHAGYTLVTGPADVGKTALVKQVLAEAPVLRVVFASPSTHTPAQIARELAGVGERADGARLRRALATNVERAKAVRRPLVVVIDDAHVADLGWLDAVRLALEAGADAPEWIRLVLVGRPALIEMLGRPQARGLWTRVTVRIALSPVSVGDAAGIVYGRLRRAGFDEPERIIPRRTLRSIVRHGQGVPSRCIEITRDSLIAAIASGTRRVGRRDVARTARALQAESRSVPFTPLQEGEPAVLQQNEPPDWTPAGALGAAVAVVALVLGGVWLARTVSEAPQSVTMRVADSTGTAGAISTAASVDESFEPIAQPLRGVGQGVSGLAPAIVEPEIPQSLLAAAAPDSSVISGLSGETTRGVRDVRGKEADASVAGASAEGRLQAGPAAASTEKPTAQADASGNRAAGEVGVAMTPPAPASVAPTDRIESQTRVPQLAPVATALRAVPKPVATSPDEAGPVITLVEARSGPPSSAGPSSSAGKPILIAKVASAGAGRSGSQSVEKSNKEPEVARGATPERAPDATAASAEPAIWQVARIARGEAPALPGSNVRTVPATKVLASLSAAGEAAGGPYAVQVGSFRDAIRAQSLVASLGDRFGRTVIETANAGGHIVYRVRLIDLPDLPAARALQSRLRDAGYDSFPVRRQ